MTMYCPHCGGEVTMALAATGQPALAPPPAQPAARRQQAANGNGRRPSGGNGRAGKRPDAPGCIDCGQPVNQRRDGSFFDTCIRCG